MGQCISETTSIISMKSAAERVAMSRLLIVAGLALFAAGVIWSVAERFGLGRLPGDIAIERENCRFYFPITTSILISAVLSLLVWLFRR
jgi:hypothetical protein